MLNPEITHRISQLPPDKRELLERLLGERRKAARTYKAPRDAQQAALVGIWAEVFGTADIGIDDDFFDLGGDSILSIQIVAKARESGMRLTARDLFDQRTIATLAANLSPPVVEYPLDAHDESDVEAQVARQLMLASRIDPDLLEDAFSLSPIQHGMLYHILSEPARPLYFEQTICTLMGDLDESAFMKAWQASVALHPSLRTGFLWRDIAEPVQFVLSHASLSWVTLDWAGFDAAERDERLSGLLETDCARRFDLAAPPLMRLTLIRVGPNIHWLVWSSYHLILDAWSLPIVIRDVFSLYSEIRAGSEAVPKSGVSYKRFVQWSKRADLQRAESFWRERLRGFTSPTKIEIPRGIEQLGKSVSQQTVELTEEQTAAIYAGLRARQLTIGTAMQAAWAAILYSLSRSSDVLFGLVVAGRPPQLAGSDSIVGPFINTLPVRVRLCAEDMLRSWLLDIQSERLAMSEFESTPLPLIQRWSDCIHDTALFETVLVVLNAADVRRLETADLRLRDVRATGFSNYPLVVRATPDERLKLEILNDAGRFGGAFTISCLNALTRLLIGMTAGFEGRVGDWLAGAAEQDGASSQPDSETLPSPAPLLATLAPRKVTISRAQLVSRSWVGNGAASLPMVRPNSSTLDAVDWLVGHCNSVRSTMLDHGGILMRGFHVPTLSTFEALARSICGELIDYRDRSTPRTLLDGKIYTSTEYPATEEIALHNEFSYARAWPMKIFFHCVKRPERGGATPVANCRSLNAALDPALSDRFASRKLLYVRNYGQGVDLTWQEAFQTDDEAAVEEYCRTAEIEFEWRGRNRLRTRQIRDAVAVHPMTGETLWFNQAHLFHVTGLHPSVRQALVQSVAEGDLPRHCYFADGAPIEAADLEAVRAAYRSVVLDVAWEEGDVLLLDNMLMAHGRRAFEGARKVVVCMGELHA